MAKKTQDPVKLQLALQGGGAKLCSLLAAMEAVQSLQRNGMIQVTRIAGTSAGSIAACLFAADVNLDGVRARWKRMGVDGSLSKYTWSPIKMAKLVAGRPVWNMDFFQRELASMFDEQQVVTLADLHAKTGIKPYIIATSLSELRSVVYDSDSDADKNIVHALMDSCSLPFFFRVWSKSGSPVIVDGGICENLPSMVLEDESNDFGPVIPSQPLLTHCSIRL